MATNQKDQTNQKSDSRSNQSTQGNESSRKENNPNNPTSSGNSSNQNKGEYDSGKKPLGGYSGSSSGKTQSDKSSMLNDDETLNENRDRERERDEESNDRDNKIRKEGDSKKSSDRGRM